jgi:orotate phosphoribosyltransferase
MTTPLVFFHLIPPGELTVKPNSLIHRTFGDLKIHCCVLLIVMLRLIHSHGLTLSFRFLCRSDGKGGVKFDVIFGPAYKGISLAAIVSSALYSDFGVDVGYAYNRKEAKDHGEGGQLVGVSMEGKRILVVDDVMTAGTAIREAHEMLKAVGAEPVGVVIALDRAEIRALDDKVSAVQAVVRDLAINVVSIVNLKELQMFLEQSKNYDEETIQSVINYRKKYGAD